MAWGFGPAGVGEHGIDTSGFPRNLGRPARSVARSPDGDRIMNPRPANYAFWIGRSETKAHVAVRSREPQGSVPEGARESERLIVPAKPANTTPREAGGGKEASGCGFVGGKTKGSGKQRGRESKIEH